MLADRILGRMSAFRVGSHYVLVSLLLVRVGSAPNVVLIVADDLGWGDVSLHGSHQVRTPNIDSLASDGVLLDNYYVSPICSPSRSALFSGRHPIHTGMQHDVINGAEPWGLPLKFKILPQYLKDRGYSTHAVGKWHLGMYKKEMLPTERGFDSFFGYLTGHEDYFDHSSLESQWGLDLRRNTDRVAGNYTGQYSTEMYTREALDVIETHDTSRPLFLYLAFQAVHAGNLYAPLQVPLKYERRFMNIQDLNRRKFVAMVSALDDAIGIVIEKLAARGILENTVIAFTTDNGGATGGRLGRVDGSYGSNWPLRGTKYTLLEGGIKGLGFIWSPWTPNYSYNGLMHIMDLMPTLYEASGGNLSSLPEDLDGLSHWQTIVNHSDKAIRNELLHNIDDVWNVSALRYGKYKIISGTVFGGIYDSWFLPPGETVSRATDYRERPVDCLASHILAEHIHNEPQTVARQIIDCGRNAGLGVRCDLTVDKHCLFDIESDPCERNNIASSEPQMLALLLQRIAAYNATAVPPNNVPVDPLANPSLHGYYWDCYR